MASLDGRLRGLFQLQVTGQQFRHVLADPVKRRTKTNQDCCA